jgi:hypothetical protein
MLISGGLVLLASLVCLGYGLLALRLGEALLPGLGRGITIGDLGILGYAMLGLTATIVHVAAPLGGVTAALAWLVGVGLLLLRRRGLARQAAAFGWPLPAALLLLAAACLYLGAMIPGATRGHFDTGLYHLQAVRQAMEFPLILGSANIHMRFGYNSAVFPTAALLSGGWPGLAAAITGNAVLLAFVILAVAQRAVSRGDGVGLRSSAFGILFIALALFSPLLILRVWIGSPNSDIPSALAVLYAFHLALRLSDLGGSAPEAAERDGIVVMLAVVVALAVMLKLSALPAILLLVVPALAWRRGRATGRAILLGLGAALALGLPWLARGVATSGCLAYPQPSSCLPVPWRIRPEVARSDLDWMRSWARRPDAPPDIVLADWSWLPDWIASLRQEPVYPTVLWLAGIALLLVVARMLLPRRLVAVRDLLPTAARLDMVALAAVALAGLAFWFVTAPLVRYGQIWLVLPLLLAIAQAAPVGWGGVSALRLAAWMASPRGRAGLALGVGLAVLASLAGKPLSRLLNTAPVRFPEIAVEARGDLAGIPVHVPLVGAQCWDAPRLCTPHLRDGLVATRFLRGWMVRDRP